MSYSTEKRPLYQIADEIKKDWTRPYFGAVPYISAMQSIDSIDSQYGVESARGLVLYFLANAGTWRGEKARAIKAELKALAGVKS
jgi:hypothetical protein